MKRFPCLILGLLVAGSMSIHTKAAVSADEIISDTAVLMDAETGQILYDKNMDEIAYPASMTKIMTGLLVCENANLDDTLVVSRSAVEIPEWNSSNIGLVAGEEMTVDEAMYALMLPSANDAANALAEHVAGSQEAFVDMMNRKAWQLGALNTIFTNAHGLHSDRHYTTAHDMAIITRYAAENADLMRYMSTPDTTISATNLQPDSRSFVNQHYMLLPENGYFDSSVLAGKTGYTPEAMHTLSTVAEQDGRKLICVVMHSPDRYNKFDDTSRLLEYGFNEFYQVTLPVVNFEQIVPFGEENAVTFRTRADTTALVRNDLGLENIRINLELPDSFSQFDELPESAEVILESGDDTLPVVAVHQPVVADIRMKENDVPLLDAPSLVPAGLEFMLDIIPDADGNQTPVLLWVISVLFMLQFFFCLVVLLRFCWQHWKQRILEEQLVIMDQRWQILHN